MDLDGLGHLPGDRRATPATAVEVTGLPTEQVDDAVTSLIAVRGTADRARRTRSRRARVSLLVRRQLRPLTEVAATAHAVAALPLAEGDIDLSERVPEHLTDERTEVGQVGAALNSLLVHVETSLEARHRSEQQVRQFVADASHELRTPLSTIVGYTELARTRPDARDRGDGPRQGRGGGRPDDDPGRGPAPAGPARLRPADAARAGRPHQAAGRGGLGRPGPGPRPPLADRGARRARSRSRATSRGCTRWSPTCSPTPASTRRPARRSP